MIQVPLDEYMALVQLAGYVSTLVDGDVLHEVHRERLSELLRDGRPVNTESPATPGQSQRGALRLIGD